MTNFEAMTLPSVCHSRPFASSEPGHRKTATRLRARTAPHRGLRGTSILLPLLGLVDAAGQLAAQQRAAQAPAISVPFEQFTLPNGLNVILHRDTTSPIMTTNLWFHVGSSH